MSGLAEIGHQEVGHRHAQVKGHWTVLGELRVNDPHVSIRGHNRARVQITVQHGFGVRGELHQQPLHLGFQTRTAAQLVHYRRKFRGVVVHFGAIIGVGKHQRLGDGGNRHIA